MSVTDLLIQRELTPDEKLYDFFSIYFDDESQVRQFYESFHGRFDSEHFVPQQFRDTHVATDFLFHPLYLHLDRAFGQEFRSSIDSVVANHVLPFMAEAIAYIPQGREDTRKKGYGMDFRDKSLEGAQVLTGDMKKFAHDRIFFGVEDEQVEALKGSKSKRKVSLHYGVTEISDLICVVHAGDERFRLLNFTITPKSELEKEDRVYPGYEAGYYTIRGPAHQLNQLEKGFAYMDILGEDGHSSGLSLKYADEEKQRLKFKRLEGRPKNPSSDADTRQYRIHGSTEQLNELEKVFVSLETLGLENPKSHIVVGYDGDGSARMSFNRVDNIPLTFPDELLTYYQGGYQGEEGGRNLTAEEFKGLIREHSSWSWKDAKGESSRVEHGYNDEYGCANLVLGRNINTEEQFHRKNEAEHFCID